MVKLKQMLESFLKADYGQVNYYCLSKNMKRNIDLSYRCIKLVKLRNCVGIVPVN